ncbi:MAG: ral secretion pathway protein GspL [Paucimonas sp.]|nr:ral secretion pathway protein GspL [Paucimonas sp.]
MSTIYIRVPSKASADSVAHWITLPCQYAVVTRGEAIEREGTAALSDLSDVIGKAQRVVLLMAASDVTLLRLQMPPLSPARLRAALPNFIEDQLMSDPAECAFAIGPPTDGLRTVGVVNRGWLDILVNTIESFGALNITALPSQLCLPQQAGVSAAVLPEEGAIELVVRPGEHEGMGLPLLPESAEAAPAEVVQTLCALIPEAPITLYVPQAELPSYRDTAETLLALDPRVTVLALAAALLIVNVVGLNIEWWRMKSEAAALQAGMTQAYRNTFPNDKVVVDPLVQMKQKVAVAQRKSGQMSGDDFLVLATHFGEAWAQTATADSKVTISSLEYRDGSLQVRFKGGGVPLDRLRAGLAPHNLTVTQPSAGTLQIRSGK